MTFQLGLKFLCFSHVLKKFIFFTKISFLQKSVNGRAARIREIYLENGKVMEFC